MNSTKSDYTQITHIVDTAQWRDVEALTFLDNNLYSSTSRDINSPFKRRRLGKVYKKPDVMTTKSRHVRKGKLFFKYGILFSFIMTLILIAVLTLNNSIINYQHSLDESPNDHTTPLTLDNDDNTTRVLDDDGDNITPTTRVLDDDDDNITPPTLDNDDRILDRGDNTTRVLDDDDDNTTPPTLDDDDRILDDDDDNTTPPTLDNDDRILDDDDDNTRVLDDDDDNTTPRVQRGIGVDNVVALEKKDVILVNKTVIIDATRHYIIVKPF